MEATTSPRVSDPVATGEKVRRASAETPKNCGIKSPQGNINCEIEFGRGPITADGQALRFTVDGEVVFAKSVGPAPAQPFLSPALHAVEDDINDRLQEAVNRAKRRV